MERKREPIYSSEAFAKIQNEWLQHGDTKVRAGFFRYFDPKDVEAAGWSYEIQSDSFVHRTHDPAKWLSRRAERCKS